MSRHNVRPAWQRLLASGCVTLVLAPGFRHAYGANIERAATKQPPFLLGAPQSAQPLDQAGVQQDSLQKDSVQNADVQKPSVPASPVHDRLVPKGVRARDAAGQFVSPTEAWAAFSDVPRPLAATTYELDLSQQVDEIGVFGNGGDHIVVSEGWADAVDTSRVLKEEVLPKAGAGGTRWHRLRLPRPVGPRLTIRIAGPTNDSRSLELWGLRPRVEVDRERSRTVAESVYSTPPAGSVVARGAPAQAHLAAPDLGAGRDATFSLTLDRPGETFARAFLAYSVEGADRFVALARQINGGTFRGGAGGPRLAPGTQIEEINPSWLRQGRNEIRIRPPRDLPQGVTVRDVRVVAVPRGPAARHDDAAKAFEPGGALADDEESTGLASGRRKGSSHADLRVPAGEQIAGLDFSITKPTSATLIITPARGTRLRRDQMTRVPLDGLAPGWHHLSLDHLPADSSGVRLVLDSGPEGDNVVVTEARLATSPVPASGSSVPEPRLVVSYPIASSCADAVTTVRGFLAGLSPQMGPLDASVDTARAPVDADGSFEVPLAAAASAPALELVVHGQTSNLTFRRPVPLSSCPPRAIALDDGTVADESAPHGQIVFANMGGTVSFGGLELVIPPGALERDTRITVRPLEPQSVPALPAEMTNVSEGGLGYRLGPHGLKFKKPVTLALPVDRKRMPAGLDSSDLGAYYFDEPSGRWQRVPTAPGTSGDRLAARTTHFTDFVAATVATPDHPSADAFNPNTLRDLKAADPSARVTFIQPPTARSDGAAHLDYPIWVPPGRRGMEPNLHLTYSSDRGNGWVGVGWDLSVGKIEVDTRFGTPRYDANRESETYLLNGEPLIRDPGAAVRGSDVRFHRRREGAFDVIIRHGTSPREGTDATSTSENSGSTYTWEVIGQAGTHSYFGASARARGSLAGGNVYEWNISRTSDVYENSIEYRYDKTVSGYKGSSVQAVALYPLEIEYTKGKLAQPQVVITLRSVPREDGFSSGRTGTLVDISRRLETIELRYGGNLFYAYNLRYSEGEFGKSLLKDVRIGVLDPDSPLPHYIHSFEYESIPRDSSGAVSFGDAKAWGSGLPASGGTSQASMDSLSASGFIGAGPGGCPAFHGGVGGSYSVDSPVGLPSFLPSKNADLTTRALVDVDGDGLPDFLNGVGGVRVNRLDESRTGGRFEPTAAVSGAAKVSYSENRSTSVQAGAHFALESIRGTIQKNWSHANELRTLADMNGDGFVDLIGLDDGAPAINYNRGSGFGPRSALGRPDNGRSNLNAEEQQESRAKFYRTDPVVRWLAPYDGVVFVGGAATRRALPSDSQGDDGVEVSLTGPSGESWAQVLRDRNPCVPGAGSTGCGNGRELRVRAGESIHFRADVLDREDSDLVDWNPTISYEQLCTGATCRPITDEERSWRDTSDRPVLAFEQASDFGLAGEPHAFWTSDSGGRSTVRIAADVQKLSTADDVTFEVRRFRGSSTVGERVFPSGLPAATPSPATAASFEGLIPITFTLDVDPGDRLVFLSSSRTSIDPARMAWAPRVEYLTFCRPGADGPAYCGEVDSCQSTADGGECRLKGDPAAETSVVYASSLYRDVAPTRTAERWIEPPGAPFIAPKDGTIVISGSSSVAVAPAAIQSQNRLLLSDSTNLNPRFGAAPFPDSPLSVQVHAGEQIWFSLFGQPRTASAGARWSVSVTYQGEGEVVYAAEARRLVADESNVLTSGGFRRWYTAEWNGERPFSTVELDRRPPQPSSDTDSNYDAGGGTWTPMSPSPSGIAGVKGPLWRGGGNASFIGPGVLSPSRVGRIPTEPVKGLRRSRSTSLALGASAILGVTTSRGSTDSEIDLLDLNGDRYPDAVANGAVQFFDGEGNFGPPESVSWGDGEVRSSKSYLADVALGTAALDALAYPDGKTKTAFSYLPTIGISVGTAPTVADLIDVNGDGLPDRVTRNPGENMQVRYNLGYSFTEPVTWTMERWGNDYVPDNFVKFVSDAAWSVPLRPASALIDALRGEAGGDWSSDVLRMSISASNNVGGGYQFIGGGLSYSANRTLVDQIDINGDGLPDQVARRPDSNQLGIKFNLGSKYAKEITWTLPEWRDGNSSLNIGSRLGSGLGSNDALEFSETTHKSGSAGYSYYFETVLFGCYGFEVGLGGGKGSTGSDLRFADVDGDGYPDHVLKVDGRDTLFVKQNPTGKANLLKRVNGPLGGHFDLGYRREGNNVDERKGIDMPNSQWALATVDVFDRPDSLGSRWVFDYRDAGLSTGRYDRTERESLGYAYVRTTRPDLSTLTQRFDTSSYYRRGLPLEEVEASGPNLFRHTTREYEDRTVSAVSGNAPVERAKFVALRREDVSWYEGQTQALDGPRKTHVKRWDYNQFGRPTSFVDEGDEGQADDLTYAIDYADLPDPAAGSPARLRPAKFVQGVDSAGTILRWREVTSFFPAGTAETVEDRIVGGDRPGTGLPYRASERASTSWRFEYWDDGLLSRTTAPNGEITLYEFQDEARLRPTSIKEGEGEDRGVWRFEMKMAHDNKWGAVASVTDTNGQSQSWEYDGYGRLIKVRGPREAVGAPAITHEYGLLPYEAATPATYRPAYAVTKHKDEQRFDTLDTAVFVDGRGRVIQTKKDAERARPGQTGIEVGHTVSGKIIYDEMSRVWQQGQVVWESGAVALAQFTEPVLKNPTTFAYDILGRVRSVKTPNPQGTEVDSTGARVVETLTDYRLEALDGEVRLSRLTRDPQGKYRTTYSTVRDEVVGVQERNTLAGTLTFLTTRYKYDAASQLLEVKDAQSNVTTATYDSLGRMVTLSSPDSGLTAYRYDESGHLREKDTAVLRAAVKAPIKYEYDRNRLWKIDYPDSVDVVYEYGTKSEAGTAQGNRAQRIKRITDESGVEERLYDELGNVAQVTKSPTPISKYVPTYSYTSKYRWDQLGRMLTLTYPDGESVSYSYNAGGLLESVVGSRATTTRYVQELLYDEFEQRVSLTLGNGAVTTYTYQPETRRLTDVVTDAAGKPLQRVHYDYDLVGNVVGMANGVPLPDPVAPNGPVAPGPTSFTFGYDDLYQLTAATGKYNGCACGCDNERRFTMGLDYDPIGNIKRKTQNDVIAWPSGRVDQQAATTYDQVYAYTSGRPHAPTRVGTLDIAYDANGNQTLSGDAFTTRSQKWNEENRLKEVAGSGFTSTFLYDAAGNRTHKRRTTLETVYVSPEYIVRNSLLQTKHIMAGETRIASATASIKTAGRPDTAGDSTVYYYHPDHLQSTSYVTNTAAEITQHAEYFPSGEVWFEETLNADSRNRQPWLFNAKELDETGLYYYGARYYDPRLSTWTSPDPILASYMRGEVNGGVLNPSNLALLTYSYNSPVTVRDPTGMSPEGDAAKQGLKPVNPSQIESLKPGNCSGTAEGFRCIGTAVVAGRSMSLFEPVNAAPNGVANPELNAISRAIDATLPGLTINPDTRKAIEGAILVLSVVAPIGGAAFRAAIEGTATEGASLAEGGTGFVVTPKGEVIPVPRGANGPVPNVNPGGRVTGTAYTGGSGGPGLDPRVSNVRIMDPTAPRGASPGYPGGYVNYQNAAGQSVNPLTGRTIAPSDPSWHIPLAP